MNSVGLYVFIAFFIAGGALTWLFRGVLQNIAAIAAEHAKIYSGAYAKACVLVMLAFVTQYGDTFEKITQAQATDLNWLGWSVLFVKPVAVALTTIVAFLDQTVARAMAVKAERTGNTNPPIPTR